MPFQPHESGIHAVSAELEPATAKDHQSQKHPGKRAAGSRPGRRRPAVVDSQVRDLAWSPAHRAKKASKGRLPSSSSRSRSLTSGRTSSPVTDAMPSAVSRARRMGLLNRARTPRSRSHRPVQVACSRPVLVSPGSPGRGSFSACCTRYVSVMPPSCPPRPCTPPATSVVPVTTPDDEQAGPHPALVGRRGHAQTRPPGRRRRSCGRSWPSRPCRAGGPSPDPVEGDRGRTAR